MKIFYDLNLLQKVPRYSRVRQLTSFKIGKELKIFQSIFLPILFVVLLSVTVSANKAWGSEKWHDSRQFESYLEKAIPHMMKHILATHVSEEGLEVQVGIFFPISLMDRDNIFDSISEHWMNSEFVKNKKYPGKIKFMQLDRPLKIVP